MFEIRLYFPFNARIETSIKYTCSLTNFRKWFPFEEPDEESPPFRFYDDFSRNPCYPYLPPTFTPVFSTFTTFYFPLSVKSPVSPSSLLSFHISVAVPLGSFHAGFITHRQKRSQFVTAIPSMLAPYCALNSIFHDPPLNSSILLPPRLLRPSPSPIFIDCIVLIYDVPSARNRSITVPANVPMLSRNFSTFHVAITPLLLLLLSRCFFSILFPFS